MEGGQRSKAKGTGGEKKKGLRTDCQSESVRKQEDSGDEGRRSGRRPREKKKKKERETVG